MDPKPARFRAEGGAAGTGRVSGFICLQSQCFVLICQGVLIYHKMCMLKFIFMFSLIH